MTTSENPLETMTDAVAYDGEHEPRPLPSFVETALPGFEQALVARRSIRVFDGELIPEETMRECLRQALLAPTSSNLQPFELYWVREAAKKARLAEACMRQPAASTAGELVVVAARPDLWRTNLRKLTDIMTKGGTRPLEGPLAEYYEKVVPLMHRTDPVGAMNLLRRVIFWWKGRSAPMVRTPVNRGDHRIRAQVQAALVAQTLMLSLSAHGYDSCPMGGIDEKRIWALLDLPRGAEVVMVISAGRRKPEGLYGPRVRFPEADLVHEVTR